MLKNLLLISMSSVFSKSMSVSGNFSYTYMAIRCQVFKKFST